MAMWDGLLTAQDRAICEASGYGARQGFGERPVVLVIDVNYNFCGDEPAPTIESIKTWRNSCGEAAWVAAEHIRSLLEAARTRRLPIIYSTGEDPRPDPFYRGRWLDKNPRGTEDAVAIGGTEIIPLIAPEPGDIVIKKAKPSAFFGTMLPGYLADLGADSLLVCGTTTSGCVRATVLDAFSYNYKVAVVEEATFDRFESSHAMTLFDLDAKYADVVGVQLAVDFVETLDDDLFLRQLPSLGAAPRAG